MIGGIERKGKRIEKGVERSLDASLPPADRSLISALVSSA